MLTKLKADALTQPGRYADGKTAGLYLQVTIGRHGDVNRSWTWRYKFAGRAREAGLGAYPTISISEARCAAAAMAALKASGRDPLALKAARIAADQAAHTFAQAAEDFLTYQCAQKANSKFPTGTAERWRSSLQEYVYPRIGGLDVRDIKNHHVVSLLKPIALKQNGMGGHSVALKLRSRVARVLDWAASHGWVDPDLPNPARLALLRDVLGASPATRHHEAPPPALAPALYRRIATEPGSIFRCLQWMILTATRISEAVGARWDEVDLPAGTWTIPSARYKTGRTHVVPLSAAARDVLTIQAQARCSDVIFPNRFGAAYDRASVGAAAKRIGVGYTLHGWRSAFRDVVADELHADNDIAEFALGHRKGGVEGAYRRAAALSCRATLMEQWACYNQDEKSTRAQKAAARLAGHLYHRGDARR
jgi:integrase